MYNIIKDKEIWAIFGCYLHLSDTDYFVNQCVSKNNQYRGCGNCYIRKACDNTALQINSKDEGVNDKGWEYHSSGRYLLLNEI